MANVPAKAEVGATETASALLIGSAIHQPRPSYEGASGGGRRLILSGRNKATKKRGIRRTRGKDGKTISPYEWAKGDLMNMQALMVRKNIAVFDAEGVDETGGDETPSKKVSKKVPWFSYREKVTRGNKLIHALGKSDVLLSINDFFDQKDKTNFVLYYTGHGACDGSWVFPISKAADDDQEEEGGEGATPMTAARVDGAAVSPQPHEGAGPTAVEITVEFHEESGSLTDDGAHIRRIKTKYRSNHSRNLSYQQMKRSAAVQTPPVHRPIN